MLYYHHDGRRWAVSNSFTQLVDHLRASGVRITANYAQLSAILSAGTASSQLFSFHTLVDGVMLAPRGTDLIVTPEKAILRRRPAVPEAGYEAGLADHLDVWAGRFETLLMNDRIGLTTDVTGGLDSRTNFGLLALAKERLGGAGTSPRLNCGSSPTNTRDLEVAVQLGERFGLEINDARSFAGHELTPEECYGLYRDLNVGTSYTLYLPAEGPTPFKIAIGGGGGEIHRKFYEGHLKSKDLERFFTSYGSRLKYPWLRDEFVHNGRVALDRAAQPGSDPLRVHYREFRHRYHVGRAPRFGVALTPLDSVTADIAQSQAGQERLDDGQFLYDLLASLNPDLIEMPFDDERKAPGPEVRARLTRVSVPDRARPGSVWAPEPERRTVAPSATRRAEVVRDAVDAALEDPFVTEFWGQEVVEAAQELVSTLLAGRSIGNAVNGKPISALLAAHVASPRDRVPAT
jgi:hypothetical protein